jgi:putative endopeptidase
MKVTVRFQLLAGAFTTLLACSPRRLASTPAAAPPASPATLANASGPAAPRPHVGAWGFDLADMDPMVAPGASFFRYTSGGWLKATRIPADRASYSEFSKLDEQSDERTRDILEAAGGTPDSDAWKAAEYYRTFMDEPAIETRGLAPIQLRLDAIATVATPAAVMVQLAAAMRRGGRSPFRVSVDQDDRQPDRYIAAISQGGLGLPDRDMYEPSARQFAAVRDGYRAYIAWVFTSLGYPEAARRAEAVYALEASIAHAHWTRVEVRDPSKIYHRMTLADLQTLVALDWQPWLEAAGLASQPAVIVREPSAIAALGALVKSQPVATWRDYLVLSVISGATRYLPRRFVEAQFEMYWRTLSGAGQLEPRWKRAVADTVYWLNTRLGEAVGPRYVAAYFTPQTKARGGVLVHNVLAAMAQRLDGLTWMSENTKLQAKAKLATYRVKIGYPKKWRDFSALSIIPGDTVGNAVRLAEFEYDRELAHLGQPIDRDEWDITPMTVNASYNPRWNEIVFPAAILQPPFFDPMPTTRSTTARSAR